MGEFETKRCRGSEGHVLPGFCPETNPWKEVALQFAELVFSFGVLLLPANLEERLAAVTQKPAVVL